MSLDTEPGDVQPCGSGANPKGTPYTRTCEDVSLICDEEVDALYTSLFRELIPPPSLPRSSNKITSRPARARPAAAATPTTPPPITAHWHLSMLWMVVSSFYTAKPELLSAPSPLRRPMFVSPRDTQPANLCNALPRSLVGLSRRLRRRLAPPPWGEGYFGKREGAVSVAREMDGLDE